MSPEELVEGQTYFVVTYPDPAMTKPIIASYEYIGTGELTDEAGTTVHVFRHMPKFHSVETDSPAVDRVFFPTDQLRDMNDIDGLMAELTEVRRKIDAQRGGD